MKKKRKLSEGRKAIWEIRKIRKRQNRLNLEYIDRKKEKGGKGITTWFEKDTLTKMEKHSIAMGNKPGACHAPFIRFCVLKFISENDMEKNNHEV